MTDADIVYLTRDPINAETPLDRQTGTITPARRHYIRDHFAIPDPPAQLVIDGAVRDTLRLGIDDIRALPRRSLVVTLECAGNGRAFLDPPAPGEQWRLGAVGTAEWTGAPLRTVLEMAGPLASAREVLFVGADAGTPKGMDRRISFERSLPLADALRDDVLLAYAMNGDDLPREHGAPLRLVVPGWYGMASVKWLAAIHVIEEGFAGFFQKERYVIGERPLREIAPRAVITSPLDGERLPVKPFAIRGYAWSGAAELARVELSTDGGRGWTDATLGPAPSRYAWREWQKMIAPGKSATLDLLARAVAHDGATQPLEPVRNELGYMNNAARPVRVVIDRA